MPLAEQTDAQHSSKVSRAVDWIRRDLRGLAVALQPHRKCLQGVHSFRQTSDHGQRHLHLRIDANGNGLLLVDTAHIFHLNSSAARIARQLLTGWTPRQVLRNMEHAHSGVSRKRLRGDIQAIERLVRTVQDPAVRCPSCALPALARREAFTTSPSAPLKVDAALSYDCNNRCSHCYNEAGRRSMPTLSDHQWMKAIDRLHQIGIPQIIFTGGEPLLHPSITTLVNHANRCGMITGLNTNGRPLATPGMAQGLAQAGLSHIQITLHSPRQSLHDRIARASGFEQTVQGIRNALEENLHVITNTTVTRLNVEEVEELIEFLDVLGIHTFAMNGIIHAGEGCSDPNALEPEELAPLLECVQEQAAGRGMRFLWYTPTEHCRLSPLEMDLGLKRCNAAEYSICVEPNGDILPCQSYYQTAGNILEDPWERIWNSPLFRSFRDRTRLPEKCDLLQKCWDCPDLKLCGGGCRLEREKKTQQARTKRGWSTCRSVSA
ncbi:radical SAM protein [Candidatus Eisenbacteria bacterium]|uniref:Radical SAM protein n=1 Tax=Eiseniibacteriota bacterium TaxID=2212470 RepID=A0ABV6YI02_UNCEI